MGYIINPYTYATGTPFDNIYSMGFDGVDDFMYFQNEYFTPTVPNASNGNPTGTISFWFKLNVDSQNEYLMGFNTKFAAGGYTRFNFRSTASWGGSTTYLRVWTSGADTDGGGGGENSCDFALYDQTYTTYGTSSVDWQKDTWYHCALVFDKDATNRNTLYLNGVAYPVPNTVGSLNGVRTITGTAAYSLPYTTGASTAGNQCIVGAYYKNFTSGALYGEIAASIDELSLYETPLTPTNITSIYNSGEPDDVSSLNPNAWYRMGDNGSWKSPQWLQPKNSNKDKLLNYSLDFDGVDDEVSLGTLEINTDEAWSVSFWANLDAFSAAYPGVFKLKTDETSGFCCFFSESGSYKGINFGANTQFVNVKTDGDISASLVGAWNNVILTYNGSGKTTLGNYSIYVNGSSVTAVASGTYGSVTNVSLIGDVTQHFNGQICDFAVFQGTELTALNASAIYNGGEPTTLPVTPTAHYAVGKDATFSTNWTVPDAIGSADGTSANMTVEDRVGDAPNSINNALSYNMDEVDREADTPPTP